MPTLTEDSMVARAILAANRPVRSSGASVQPERMVRHETLAIWYDPQHAFLVSTGCLAVRAADDHGRFCWLVRQAGEADTLSYTKSPYDVVPAPGGDTGLGIPHPAVTELAASLRADAGAAANTGLMATIRMLGSYGLPGSLAGWLRALGRSVRSARIAAPHPGAATA